MSELFEGPSERAEFAKLDKADFLALLTRMENYYIGEYEDALGGLAEVNKMRRAIFQAEEDGLIVICTVDEDGTARVGTKAKAPMGFAK